LEDSSEDIVLQKTFSVVAYSSLLNIKNTVESIVISVDNDNSNSNNNNSSLRLESSMLANFSFNNSQSFNNNNKHQHIDATPENPLKSIVDDFEKLILESEII